MLRFNKILLALSFIGLAILGAGCTTTAQQSELHHSQVNENIHVHDQWVRAVPPVSLLTAAYMTLINHGEQDDKLLSVKSSIAKVVEIHNVKKENGMMQMYPVSHADIPAAGTLELKPGSFHIMLIDLVKKPKLGENVELILHLKNAGTIKVVAPVKEGQPMKHKMNHDSTNHDS